MTVTNLFVGYQPGYLSKGSLQRTVRCSSLLGLPGKGFRQGLHIPLCLLVFVFGLPGNSVEYTLLRFQKVIEVLSKDLNTCGIKLFRKPTSLVFPRRNLWKYTVTVDGTKISYVAERRFFGATFRNCLPWTQQAKGTRGFLVSVNALFIGVLRCGLPALRRSFRSSLQEFESFPRLNSTRIIRVSECNVGTVFGFIYQRQL